MAEPHIPFLASGAYPTRAGNRLRPLVDGIPAFRRICEAIDAAKHSVWLTVAFIGDDFQMPDGRGSLFDVLDCAVERGLDVRALFWRLNPETSHFDPVVFSGSSAHRDMLRRRGSRIRIRWDRASGSYCQHQKIWVMDAGHASETAFVGGINIDARSVVSPGHWGRLEDRHNHDAYVEVTGPSATDVHHNFVQRWNEASERKMADGVWADDGETPLPFPDRLSPSRGESLVQIQRTMPAGRYSDGRASPGGRPQDIAGGERSIFEQYKLAIDAARRTVYIENQAIPVPDIGSRLEAALKRGVEIVLLLPASPEDHVRAALKTPERRPFLDQLIRLGRYDNFTLVGIAGADEAGGRHNVYVHAKIMLVDDAWATLGSCNLHPGSLFGHTEVNASFWDPEVVRRLRCELLSEHLDQDTAHLDDRAALRLYRQVAQENRKRLDGGNLDWQGLAFTLDAETYGA